MDELDILSKAISDRDQEWAVPLTGKEDLLFRSNELGGEAGELQNQIKKYVRYMMEVPGGDSDIDKVADEIADVVISAVRIANYLEIDVWPAIIDKFNHTSEKHGFITKIKDNNG